MRADPLDAEVARITNLRRRIRLAIAMSRVFRTLQDSDLRLSFDDWMAREERRTA